MNTLELTGHALGWAVAVADGTKPERIHFNVKPFGLGRRTGIWIGDPLGMMSKWTPWKVWSQGGPIIERKRIHLCPVDLNGEPSWQAWLDAESRTAQRVYGAKPLIAAMRCFVFSELGEDVDVPKEIQ